MVSVESREPSCILAAHEHPLRLCWHIYCRQPLLQSPHLEHSGPRFRCSIRDRFASSDPHAGRICNRLAVSVPIGGRFQEATIRANNGLVYIHLVVSTAMHKKALRARSLAEVVLGLASAPPIVSRHFPPSPFLPPSRLLHRRLCSHWLEIWHHRTSAP